MRFVNISILLHIKSAYVCDRFARSQHTDLCVFYAHWKFHTEWTWMRTDVVRYSSRKKYQRATAAASSSSTTSMTPHRLRFRLCRIRVPVGSSKVNEFSCVCLGFSPVWIKANACCEEFDVSILCALFWPDDDAISNSCIIIMYIRYRWIQMRLCWFAWPLWSVKLLQDTCLMEVTHTNNDPYNMSHGLVMTSLVNNCTVTGIYIHNAANYRTNAYTTWTQHNA